ncbi:MAG TPA: tripartite tricarboxylate transporter substrate binding protein [Xanthobacteraceae bacterium]|jgi:tripartite-type tricarboxylate transporter receptor subunit TctC
MIFRGAAGILLAGLVAAAPVEAKAWPERTVRVIMPNPPGTTLDVIARLFAEKLAANWRQPVIVENLPGADGNLAAREFVGRHDNHVLLYSFPGLITINPLLYEKLPYDPVRDLVPIAFTSDNFIAIASSGSLKVDSVAGLVELARSRAAKLNWAATPGLPYFALAGLQRAAGVAMVQVPYRDFSQAVGDLGEGRIDAAAAGVTPFLSSTQAGKVRLLAFINRQRAPFAPSVPTIAEAGYPDLTFDAVTGFFGWRDMPPDLRERLAADVREVASDPAVRERLLRLGSVPRSGTPAEFVAAVQDQRDKIAAIARAIGTKAQ